MKWDQESWKMLPPREVAAEGGYRPNGSDSDCWAYHQLFLCSCLITDISPKD